MGAYFPVSVSGGRLGSFAPGSRSQYAAKALSTSARLVPMRSASRPSAAQRRSWMRTLRCWVFPMHRSLPGVRTHSADDLWISRVSPRNIDVQRSDETTDQRSSRDVHSEDTMTGTDRAAAFAISRPFAGSVVEYHGTHAQWRGQWRSEGPCHCKVCQSQPDEVYWRSEARFELHAWEATPLGRRLLRLTHVREASVTVLCAAPDTPDRARWAAVPVFAPANHLAGAR